MRRKKERKYIHLTHTKRLNQKVKQVCGEFGECREVAGWRGLRIVLPRNV